MKLFTPTQNTTITVKRTLSQCQTRRVAMPLRGPLNSLPLVGSVMSQLSQSASYGARILLLFITCLGLSACSASNILSVFDALDGYAANVNPIQASNPAPIGTALNANALPTTYSYGGKDKSLSSFLRTTGTASFVVIHNGQVVHENYYLGKSENSRFTSWSVAKSFASALIGIAIQEGHIQSVTDPIINYVPEIAGTAYAATTIEDVLEMASGVRFDETYFIGTDVANLQLAISDKFMDEIVKYTETDNTPGTFNRYKSLDTLVLGLLIRNATGQSVASYLEAKIWGPAGMTNDAHWLADADGLEATYCCIKATTRDFAKLGLIYLNNGFYNGQQIVPAPWIAESLDFNEPHLLPGDNPNSDYDWGYGYQWWFRDEGNDYSAVGIFNQFVYINPDANVVIAKNSGAPNYLLNDLENEHFAVFRAISEHLDSQ